MSMIEEFSNEDIFIHELNIPRINTISVTFNHLIQCGVDKFLTVPIREYEGLKTTPHEERLNKFLLERAIVIPEKKLSEAYFAIEDIFSYYLPDNYNFDQKYQGLWGIKSFLQELLVASNTGTSIFVRIDKITEDLLKAKELLPLELYSPISFLVNSITQDTVDLPQAKYSLNKDEIKRFKKVFVEQPFMDYMLAHTLLDNEKEKKSNALTMIQKSTISLYERHKGLMSIKRSILTTLSVTPKIIDATFGKIPGSIADLATKILSNMIDLERRIVIYDYSPLYHEIYHNRLLVPLRKKIQQEKEDKRKK
jgi:hypothetical protein